MVFFFFSSRRRHTRFDCDWSSDVCSSDLFADLLKDAAVTNDPKNARYLQNIITSGKHLLALITDLLDLAKIEAGEMEVRAGPLSLTDLFEGLISIIKPLAGKKELSIVASGGRDLPIMQSDPPKVPH